MRLEGKRAIVTGAASGLGRAIADMFVREGARVVFADIKHHEGELPEGSRDYKLDISKKEEVQALVDYTIGEFGGLDIMVNNAGVGLLGEVSEMSDETWDKVLSINLNGVFYGMRAATAYMKREGIKGSVINMSSILGKVGFRTAGAYCVSKGGVNQLTRTASLELAPAGIRVNSIAPGFIKTEMTKDFQDNKEFLASIPMGHMGEPDDIAQAAVYLASDESKYATGSVLYVDGGWVAQ